MHWYDGTIAEAVTLSKQKNAIFVVFVEGSNDLSTEMAATIDDASIIKRLSDEDNFLAVKLKSGTINYTHFAQIYQFVPVPSLFFIGRNGTPLEVVCAGVQPDNLATRIDRILEEHLKDKQTTGLLQSTSTQDLRQQTASLLHAEAASSRPADKPPAEQPETSSGPPAKMKKTEFKEITKSGKEYEVVCEDDVCVRKLKVQQDDPGPSHAVPQTPTEPMKVEEKPQPADETLENLEEKMERAKELIEARRREKAEKEKELERQKELERRAAGQGVAELKRWQADQELKQIQEERRRERMENNLARQRVLEQIAQDRAERRSRDRPAPAPAPAPATSGDTSNNARIQFKLPDGTSHTANFDSEGTLADVQTYVANTLQLSRSNFAIWTAFPRQELVETESTLRDLKLTPSAALLVLPRRLPNTVATPSTYDNFISFVTQIFTSFILIPSQQLYNWIRNRLFPSAPPAPRRISPDPAPRGVLGVPGIRRRGNIHRLGEEASADDDNNTWNGNSTQQM